MTKTQKHKNTKGGFDFLTKNAKTQKVVLGFMKKNKNVERILIYAII